MKALYLLLSLISISFSVSAQWETIDSTFIEGELYGRVLENKTNGFRRHCEFSDGQLLRIETSDYTGHELDSQFFYHHNGILGAVYYFAERNYCSEFTLFDTAGVKFYSGSFWNSVRTGRWQSYDKKGNVTSWVDYVHNYGDEAINEENAKALTANKATKFGDTLVTCREGGYSYRYPSCGMGGGYWTWGEVKEIHLPDKLPLDNASLYYKDGVIGWYPLTPLPSIIELADSLPGYWDVGMYDGEPIHEEIGIPVVWNVVHNYEISQRKWAASFDLIFYSFQDEKKVREYYSSQKDYKYYKLGDKLYKGTNFYYLRCRSYFVVVQIDGSLSKLNKVYKEFLPTFNVEFNALKQKF